MSKWVGERVKELRHQKGISQEQLADRCGINRSHMGKIERGEINVGIDTLFTIATRLDVRMAEFFTGI